MLEILHQLCGPSPQLRICAGVGVSEETTSRLERWFATNERALNLRGSMINLYLPNPSATGCGIFTR